MLDKDYACEDWGTENEWTQIKVTVKLTQLDDTVAVMNMVSNYLQIEDYSDIDLKTCYGDLIDEAIRMWCKDGNDGTISLKSEAETNSSSSIVVILKLSKNTTPVISFVSLVSINCK